MRTVSIISAADVSEAVAALYQRINTELRPDVLELLRAAMEREDSELARDLLGVLLENEQAARTEGVPLCQDTGMAVAFVRMGARAVIEGGTLQEAIDEGVRRAAAAQPLRASLVSDPLERRNTGDNTPSVVHLEQVAGEGLEIALMAKGGGAENMSRVCMLAPGQGRQGVIEAVVETVRRAGANPCPPIIVGVGLGGNFERAALLAKRALLRDLREPNAEPALRRARSRAARTRQRAGHRPAGLRRAHDGAGRARSSRPRVTSPACRSASTSSATRTATAR